MLTNTPNDPSRPCRVLVRCRPLTKKQTQSPSPLYRQKIIRKNQNTLYLYEPQLSQSHPMKFNFDKVFLESDSNTDVFEEIEEAIADLIKGYNTAIMAYGMTGAGKSHTMFGGEEEQGLVAMILKFLLGVEGLKAKLSLVELYNEQLRDLLVQNSGGLQIMEDSQGNVIVPELSWHELGGVENLETILRLGTAKRVTASTASNSQSSRSHCIIQVEIELEIPEGMVKSKLFLIDLAGSERATENKGLRLQQGANINKSLLSLSNCIIQLSENSQFVPYRDSKLTRLLKETLGGNSKSVIIACISPSYLSYDETVNTLKYSSKAARIKREVQPNVKNDDKDELEFLRKEVSKLRELLREKDKEKERYKQNHRPLSPQPRRDSSLWKTPKNPSPTSSKIKSRIQKQNEALKNMLRQKQNEIQNKDETIKNLMKQLVTYKQNLTNYETRSSKQNSIPLPNESKIRRIDIKRPEIPLLELIREKTRLFKNKLKSVCAEYEAVSGRRERIPRGLIESIGELGEEYDASQGAIIINQQYLSVLTELRKLTIMNSN